MAPEFMAAQMFAPDVVVIMLGTNDAKGSWTSADGPHHFEPDYRAMVAVFLGLPKKPKVFLAWPPPMVRPALAAAEQINKTQVEPIITRIASDTKSGLVKVHDAFFPSPLQYFGAGDGVDIADGLHPNDAGHRAIARAVFCALEPGATPANGGARCGGTPPPPVDGGADAAPARDAGPDGAIDARPPAIDAAPDEAEDGAPDAGAIDAEDPGTGGSAGGAGGSGGRGGSGAGGSTGGSGGSIDGSGGATGGSGASAGDTGEPDPTPPRTAQKAGGCSLGGGAPSVGPLLVLLGALLRRRRR